MSSQVLAERPGRNGRRSVVQMIAGSLVTCLGVGSLAIVGPPSAGAASATTTVPKRNVTTVRLAEARVAKARSGGDQRLLADEVKNLGYQYLLAKDFAASVKALKEAAELYRKTKDDRSLADTLQMQGWALIQWNKPGEALVPLDEAIALRRKAQSTPSGPASLAETLQLRGQALQKSGKSAEAIKTLEEVLALAASGARGIDTASTSITIGSIYMELKNPGAAVKYFERAVAETQNKPAPRIDALQALGWALTGAGRADEAVPTLQRAIKEAGPAIDKVKQGVDLWSLLANAAREAKQPGVEIGARIKIVSFARAKVPGADLTAALEGLGLTYLFDGKFTEAIPPLRELVDLSRGATKPARLGSALHNLGWSLTSSKQTDEAITVLDEAVKVRTQINDPDLLASLRFLGYAMWSAKDPRAVAVFTKALRLLEASPKTTDDDLGQGYLDLSSSYLYEGNPDPALAPAMTALDVFTKGKVSDELIATANYNIGWALFTSRRPADALPYLTKARDIRTKNAYQGASDAADMLEAATAQTKAA